MTSLPFADAHPRAQSRRPSSLVWRENARLGAYGLALLLFFLTLWRRLLPATFVDGTAWAEIGTDFLPTAYFGPIAQGLVTPDSGYLALFARLVSLVPVLLHVPIAIAPLLVQHLCTTWQLICLLSILHPHFRVLIRRDLTRALICLLLMLHPDAELKSVINSAYWGVIPFVLLAWADSVHVVKKRAPRVGLGFFGVTLAVSKAQMVALAPYVLFRAVQQIRQTGVRDAVVWLVVLLACGVQLLVAVSHIHQVEGALWLSGEGAAAYVPRDTWRLLRFALRTCLGDGGCVGLRHAPIFVLVALLCVVVTFGVCLRILIGHRDKVTEHIGASAPLLVVPALVLVAKMPVVMAQFYGIPCGFVAYRGMFVSATVCFLGVAVTLGRATEVSFASVAMRRAATLALAWLAFFSQPFGGASWLLPQPLAGIRPSYREMCAQRGRFPGSGNDRWLSLFALHPDPLTMPRIVPVNPFPFALPRGCTLLRDRTSSDALPLDTKRIETDAMWTLPNHIASARIEALALHVKQTSPSVRAQLLSREKKILASVVALPSLSPRNERVAYFQFFGPVADAAFLRVIPLAPDVLEVETKGESPLWHWYGTTH